MVAMARQAGTPSAQWLAAPGPSLVARRVRARGSGGQSPAYVSLAALAAVPAAASPLAAIGDWRQPTGQATC